MIIFLFLFSFLTCFAAESSPSSKETLQEMLSKHTLEAQNLGYNAENTPSYLLEQKMSQMCMAFFGEQDYKGLKKEYPHALDQAYFIACQGDTQAAQELAGIYNRFIAESKNFYGDTKEKRNARLLLLCKNTTIIGPSAPSGSSSVFENFKQSLTLDFFRHRQMLQKGDLPDSRLKEMGKEFFKQDFEPFNAKAQDTLVPCYQQVLKGELAALHNLIKWYCLFTRSESYPNTSPLFERQARIAVLDSYESDLSYQQESTAQRESLKLFRSHQLIASQEITLAQADSPALVHTVTKLCHDFFKDEQEFLSDITTMAAYIKTCKNNYPSAQLLIDRYVAFIDRNQQEADKLPTRKGRLTTLQEHFIALSQLYKKDPAAIVREPLRTITLKTADAATDPKIDPKNKGKKRSLEN